MLNHRHNLLRVNTALSLSEYFARNNLESHALMLLTSNKKVNRNRKKLERKKIHHRNHLLSCDKMTSSFQSAGLYSQLFQSEVTKVFFSYDLNIVDKQAMFAFFYPSKQMMMMMMMPYICGKRA